MPELPEVENVRQQLLPHVLNKKIVQVKSNTPKIIKDDKNFEKKVVNEEFTNIDRIGKLLIFDLKNSTHKILCHLKMTGQLIYTNKKGQLQGGGHSLTETDLNLPHKHTHLILYFEDGSKLFYNDVRKFGYFHFATKEEAETKKKNYGIEPLTSNYTLEKFLRIFENRRTNLKSLLLNQKLISGLGNIYVDESCFRSNVLPTRLVSTITKKEKKDLFIHCQEILKEAIESGGTTFYNFINAQGEKGNFSERLQVFNRTKKPCFICGSEIKKIKFNGRGTHFCPKCQK